MIYALTIINDRGVALYRLLIILVGCLALTGCGDPLAKVERLSDVPVSEDQTVALAVPGPEETADQPGILSRWFSDRSPEASPEGAAEKTNDAEELSEKTSPLAEDISDQDKPKRSLFAPRKRASGPEVEPVSIGTVLPFGKVARACDARGSVLGKEIARFPLRGKGYRLHDSAPGTTAPHTFYVTGFQDGCPRQFTAALAIFGAPSMYEQLRYGEASENHNIGATDKAYERVKSQVCGVSRRKPCGRKIKTLERDTVFISTYERFEDNARWADILVHDGAVMAANIK